MKIEINRFYSLNEIYMHKCKTRNCCRHWFTRGHFFNFNNSNKTKLSHEQILEIIWYWS